MANYRKKAHRNARAGCRMCKPWKKHSYKCSERQRFSDYKRIVGASQDITDNA